MKDGPPRPTSTASDTRRRIVSAAAEVMSSQGLAKATTKAIAKEAGYSEATLYKHFVDKEALFVHVLRESFPPFVSVLARLPESAGRGSVRAVLADVVVRAVPFYRHGAPMLGSLFADRGLLRRHREAMVRENAGPMNVNLLLAEYLRREQECGRVKSDLDPDRAAALLIGACFQRGFLEAYQGVELPMLDEFAHSLVGTLVAGMEPHART